MADNAAGFVNEWLSQNVQNYPLEDKSDHVSQLVRQLLDDAMRAGYSEEDLEDLLGDVNDYVTDHFEQVQDSDLGFKD